MAHPKYLLTQAELMEALSYDRNTGIFTWISKRSSRSIILGSRAGSLDAASGYRRIRLNGHLYVEHALVWLYCEGKFPDGILDHEDQNKSNNKRSNLRDVTHRVNMQNLSARKGTSTGVQGIWYCKTRNVYIAEITLNGKKVFQKKFDDATQAEEAREAKLKDLGFHVNHGTKH